MIPYVLRRLAMFLLWLAVTGLGGYLAYRWWGLDVALLITFIWCASTGLNISDSPKGSKR